MELWSDVLATTSHPYKTDEKTSQARNPHAATRTGRDSMVTRVADITISYINTATGKVYVFNQFHRATGNYCY